MIANPNTLYAADFVNPPNSRHDGHRERQEGGGEVNSHRTIAEKDDKNSYNNPASSYNVAGFSFSCHFEFVLLR